MKEKKKKKGKKGLLVEFWRFCFCCCFAGFVGIFFSLLIKNVDQSIQGRERWWKKHAYSQRYCQWLNYQKKLAADMTKLQTPLAGVLRTYHEEICHRRHAIPYWPPLYQCWTDDSLRTASAVHCGATATKLSHLKQNLLFLQICFFAAFNFCQSLL